jgi:hypothetical protein
MQNLRADSPRGRSGVRPSFASGALDTFIAAEKDFFHVGPLEEVEEHLQRLMALMTELATKARTRRQSVHAEKCFVCGGPWKFKMPDGGRIPHGNKLWHEDDGTTIQLYSCDAACHSKLEYMVEKRTIEVRKKRDTESIAAQREMAAKRARR